MFDDFFFFSPAGNAYLDEVVPKHMEAKRGNDETTFLVTP